MGFLSRLRELVIPTKILESSSAPIPSSTAKPDALQPYRELKMADLTDVPIRMRICSVERTKAGKPTYVCVRATFEGLDDAELFLRIPIGKFRKLMMLIHKRGGNSFKNYLKGNLYDKYFVNAKNSKQRELFAL